MLDFYINDSEYCLVDETYISLGKVYESKSEIVNFDQCILSDEVRDIEIAKAINQIESGEAFAFYNLGFSEEERELLSNVGIEEFNDITINTSISKLKELKQEVSLALIKMQGVDVLRLDGLSNLITRLMSVVMGELDVEEYELRIRSRESYQSEEDCLYWHLDKSEEEILGNSNNVKEKRFIMVLKGELVDPIMGESLRNGKITFKGGLLAEGISKGIAYIKNEQVKTKIKNWEIRNQEEKMRREVEEITKGEQGQYEYVGEGRKVEPGMVWDALNQDNVGGVVEGQVGDSYKCKAGICIADEASKIGGSRIGGNKEGEKWSKMPVKKGDTVWRIYGDKPTQQQLEEFAKKNPYIAARGVVRDADGNIKHLEIRAGETTLVHNFAIYLSKYHAT